MAEAVDRLGLADRVLVATGRAEDLARRPDLRTGFDVVTARAFGPPAVTAECSAGFVRVGGVVLVSEPPDAPERRWPADGLRQLGFRSAGVVGEAGMGVRVLKAVAPCPDRYPRRVGVPAKRPLF